MPRAVDFEDCGIAEAISKYRLKVPVNQRSYKWEDGLIKGDVDNPVRHDV